MRIALVLVAALLLSGCAAEDPSTEELADAAAPAGGLAPFEQAVQEPLRFASGDFEGEQADTATFTITAQCFMDCSLTGGEEIFDLTPLVPADAPVELTVSVSGARASLEFQDASALGAADGEIGEFDGTATNFGTIVTRGSSGKVLLHIYNPGGFGFPPNPSPTASYEARSVVRADRLAPGVPAGIAMKPGQMINITDDSSVMEVLMIDPAGVLTRDQEAPFSLAANGTAGEYTLLVVGGEAVPVYGPDVPMVAKRIALVEDEPHALTSGSATTWSFDADSRPLAVGIEIDSVPTPGGPEWIAAGATMTQFEASVTAPGNVVVLQDSQQCTPMCGFVLGGFSWGISSEYLDEALQPGSYEVSVAYTGNGMQAHAWHLVIV